MSDKVEKLIGENIGFYMIAMPIGLFLAGIIIGIGEVFGPLGSKSVSGLFFLGGIFVIGYDIFWVVRKVMSSISPASAFPEGAINTGYNNKSNSSGQGVFFGVDDRGRKVVRNMDKDGHVLVVGGPGTGKTSCIAIPMLKDTWASNFLAIDIKGELAKKSGREAHIFNPFDSDAFGYDPFYIIENDDNPVAALRDIALTLVPESPNAREPFWIQSAQSILTGHLIYAYSQNASFYEALRTIQTVDTEKLLRMAAEHEEASIFVSKFLDTPAQTLGGIMSQLSNNITPLVGDSYIRQALTKKSSQVITPDMLSRGESIFLQIPESKINAWRQFITLIVQQHLAYFEQREEGVNQPVLFLLDEFPRLGKMEGILNGLATLRSKKVTICLIVQSLAQLDAIYGQDNRKIIVDNCGYQVVLGASNADTQSYFSRMAGTRKRTQVTKTKQENQILYMISDTLLNIINNRQPQRQKTSISTVEFDEPYIRPEEFGRLGNSLVLFSPGSPPAYVRKCPYYNS